MKITSFGSAAQSWGWEDFSRQAFFTKGQARNIPPRFFKTVILKKKEEAIVR
jgi:hypothetical protein